MIARGRLYQLIGDPFNKEEHAIENEERYACAPVLGPPSHESKAPGHMTRKVMKLGTCQRPGELADVRSTHARQRATGQHFAARQHRHQSRRAYKKISTHNTKDGCGAIAIRRLTFRQHRHQGERTHHQRSLALLELPLKLLAKLPFREPRAP